MDVIEIRCSQNLVINPSFTMLARGFMTIEGVVADLSPTTNIVKIVSDHIQKKTLTLDADAPEDEGDGHPERPFARCEHETADPTFPYARYVERGGDQPWCRDEHAEGS